MKKDRTKTRWQKRAISLLLAVMFLMTACLLTSCEYISLDDIFDILLGEEIGMVGSRGELTSDDLQVHYIDVGQADAILVRVPSGGSMKNMLIDAGTSEGYGAAVVTDYLSALGIQNLEYFVITHPHLDHIGAADEVIASFDVETVIMPDCEASTKAWERVLLAIDENDVATDILTKPGDTYHIGDASFRILAPIDPASVKNTNNYSIVMRLVYGDTSFMFTGDAETDSEEESLERFSSSDFRADVLKVGHHGSTTSTSPEFLAAVSPSLAVISCGKDNEYGHPHDETLELLGEQVPQILRTDIEGTVIVCSDRTEVYVLTSN